MPFVTDARNWRGDSASASGCLTTNLRTQNYSALAYPTKFKFVLATIGFTNYDAFPIETTETPEA